MPRALPLFPLTELLTAMESSTSAPPRTRPSASRSTPPPENTLGGNRPRTVLEVLCRELGTSHPDAALRQIRTMKRLLRQRHRAARKLRRLDVDGAEEAARTIADLQSRIRTLKSEYKAQAEERIAVINTMARALETLRQRLRASAPEAAEGTSATDAPAHTNGTANTNGVPQSAPHAEMEELTALLNQLRREVDEIRLELWCYQKEDDDLPSYPDDGRMANDLLDRIEQRANDVSSKYDALYEAYQRTK